MTKKTTDESKMDVEQWLAIRKEVGLKIDPETAEVDWHYARTFDPYCLSCRTFRRNIISGGNTSPAHPKATYGSGLAICPRQPVRRFEKGTAASWRFQVDWRISRRNRLTIECLSETMDGSPD